METTNTTHRVSPLSLTNLKQTPDDYFKSTTPETTDPEQKPATQTENKGLDAEKESIEELKAQLASLQKRTSDQKSYYDKRLNKEAEEKAELLKQLESAQAATSSSLPLTEEEFNAAVEENPLLNKYITTMLRKELQKERELTSKELESLKQATEQARIQEEWAKIRKAHPDIDVINDSEEFAEWFAVQPKGIQNLVQSTNAEEVIRAVTLYKAEAGIESPKDKKVKASEAVSTAKATNTDAPQPKVWSLAEIRKMPIHLYEKYEEEIKAAQREGRIKD